jgi:HD-GYP domain-containing protein (c-di-GMP phosphodiesterase class II)
VIGENVTSPALAAPQEVAKRCLDLGLPVVHTDESGRLRRVEWVAGDALGREVLQRLVDSSIFERAFTGAARALQDGEDSTLELLAGWHAVALPITERRAVVGYVVALALEPSAIEGEAFDELCGSAGVDPEAAHLTLRPAATYTSAGAGIVASLLRSCLEDRRELGACERAIEEFSAQLAESYEEISLFYSIGRAMKELVTAEAFMQHLCEQMHETLPYAWIAARFLKTSHASTQLIGRTFRIGESDRVNIGSGATLAEIVDRAREFGKPETMVLSLDDRAEALARIIQRDDETVGVLVAGEKQGGDPSVSSVDMKLLDGAARLAEVVIANTGLYEDQQRLFLGTLEALTSAIDAKDPYTCGHSQRVSELSRRLGEEIGLEPAELETLRISGLVHDIGKIGVPERVLLKASRLTDEEFDLIKRHPEIGHRILRDIPLLEGALPGVMHHHERWDGRGYPARLAGEDIPMIARIIGVADAFDAMSSSRTYRAAMPRQKVLDEIANNAGKQFDPRLAEAFLQLDLSFYDAMLASVLRSTDSEAA